MSIVEFLRARYEECRAHAGDVHRRGCESVPDVLYPDREPGACDCREPGAVLADLDTKLVVLDEHPDVNDGDCGTCVDGRWGYPTHGGSSPQRYPCRTLRHLAVPFAAHPDYDERWRP